ncbi:c-type cytochrome biogenesis protein CcmI [Ferrimonas pelagia]|uniref:C-type cytochrome biogenesis protein CcmI n=1 Tax=Ferrimonas pelagia TaxID=1177826 RepID=A0ABP9FH67_9GAMM
MNLIWSITLCAALALLSLLWLHHVRYHRQQHRDESQLRQSTNLALFQLRLDELELAQRHGEMDASEMQRQRQELEVALLQDVSGQTQTLRFGAAAKGWPFLLSATILVGAMSLYSQYGEPVQWQFAQVVDSQNMEAQREIQQLVEVLRREPENVMAWYSLGQATLNNGQYAHAITSLDKLMEIVGPHPELLGHRATAMYYLSDQQMTADVMSVAQRALSLDNADPTTRLFLATQNYLAGNYQTAVEHWQVLLDTPRKGVDLEAIRNAKHRALARM